MPKFRIPRHSRVTFQVQVTFRDSSHGISSADKAFPIALWKRRIGWLALAAKGERACVPSWDAARCAPSPEPVTESGRPRPRGGGGNSGSRDRVGGERTGAGGPLRLRGHVALGEERSGKQKRQQAETEKPQRECELRREGFRAGATRHRCRDLQRRQGMTRRSCGILGTVVRTRIPNTHPGIA